jgi:HK97 gp10 family phage protein
MTIRLDPSADQHLDAALHAALDKIAAAIAEDARALAPVRNGRLKASIFHDTVGLTARIGTDVTYWRYVEYGTGPHIIRPSTAKALFWEGAAHPVAYVRHPGTPAQPFLRPALLQTREL